ncbi:sensor histidine kinase [Longivirga aurantiaca]|uniref:Sensor histidine kinase n=1 Tax=Longivirga aurantiaca TaxID=1837743 RepID=A0ABW1T5G1_9ACTN
MPPVVVAVVVAVVLVAVAVAALRVLRRGDLGSEADKATYATLNRASQAAPALREGLTEDAAESAARHLHALLGSEGFAITDTDRVLATDGAVAEGLGMDAVATVLASGRAAVTRDVGALGHVAVVAPLVVEDRVVGALVAVTDDATANLVRATTEVARWVSSQLELAELDASRARLAEAEVRALRAQISPHFIYNALTAIASYVRTDPEHARELLLEFADFTRYSFRRHGDFTTLAEELRSIDRYLTLERARFGDRLQVTVRVAPEVLPVAVPYLCLQPIVENAVRHGLEGKAGPGHITILAEDAGSECLITVEDDGIGADPEQIRLAMTGEGDSDSIGVGNVDERMRTVFGDEYGLVVETGPGLGTKVSMRVPKFTPGVHA